MLDRISLTSIGRWYGSRQIVDNQLHAIECLFLAALCLM